MAAVHTEARFNNDDAAREHLEAIRWPHGPECPHCGGCERISRLNGESHRAGLLFCGDCRKQFSVTVGTVFERSKVALHKWVYACHLMCASKKGISAKQLERMLGVTYKTAWFIAHRVREMSDATHDLVTINHRIDFHYSWKVRNDDQHWKDLKIVSHAAWKCKPHVPAPPKQIRKAKTKPPR